MLNIFIPLFYSFFGVFFSSTLLIADNGGDCIIINISQPILNGNDDVEERPDGSIYMNSTDIELIHDLDAGDQFVGLRFTNLLIPQGVEVLEAYLQFTTDQETSNGNCDLNIWAEAADDAAAFEAINLNVSNRNRTDAQVNWQPLDWNTIGQVGDRQKTPDLTSIVQEVINRPSWASGHSMNFIIEGSGRRVAAAFELNASQAVRLNVKLALPIPDALLEQVFINELMPANGLVQDEYGEADDWVEIYNGGTEPIFLSGLYLSDDLNDLKKWQITAPIALPPDGFGMIWMDDQVEQGGAHANFKLKSTGEFLALSQELDGEMHVLDALEFPETPLNVSYGRVEDGMEDWVFFGAYSPKESNNDKLQFLKEQVHFSKEGGRFEDAIVLEMSVLDPDAQIYYTLNGKNPTVEDALYQTPLPLSQTTLVRARAFKTGFIGSTITTDTYIFAEGSTLPILSVQSDPENFWNDETGIYVSGTNGTTGFCSDQPRNWNQDWERPGNISFFEPDGTKGFQVNVGIKVGGGCSRTMKMKGLNFFCRSSQYGDELIDYPVFPGLEVQEFRRLKIRNSGNDFEQMLFRDGINQTILRGTVDLDLMAYRPVKVYLNGAYWGVYGLREFFNEDYVASHFSVDPNNVEVIANPQVPWYEVKEGDYMAFQTLINFIENNNLQTAANYEQIANMIDINEYLNYHIAQIYLGNYDWPANNVRVWRDQNGGKFRWMLFDTDATTNYGWWSASNSFDNTLQHALNAVGDPWPNGPESTLLLRKMIENEGFRHEFIQRTCTFRELIFPTARISPMTDSLQALLEPEMQQHLNRWNGDFPNLGWGTPSGGSLTAWRSFISNYKNFFTSRRTHIISHFRATLGLEDVYKLIFIYDEETPGSIFIHQNEMAIPYNYNGEYFSNIPIKIKAVAKPGFRFHHWLETGDTSAEINFIGTHTSRLTPIFVPDHPILTEIHYHPEQGEDYEFLEWYNPSDVIMDLSGLRFTKGIDFEFPEGVTLASESYLLVVKDKSKFETLSCQVYEWESGTLENTGETVEVVDDQEALIQSITYQSSGVWPEAANGMGSSLSLKNPFLNNQLAENWEASFLTNGTPCGDKFPIEEEEEGEDPINFLLEIFPNPVSTNLFFKYASVEDIPLELEFFNTLGQKIFQIELTPTPFLQETQVSVKGWAVGVYYVVLKDREKEEWIKQIIVD